jgi:hypothetical protein
VLASRDGVGIQPSNLCEQADPAAAVLLGKETDEQTARPFVGSGDEAIDPAMLLGARAAGMLLAV